MEDYETSSMFDTSSSMGESFLNIPDTSSISAPISGQFDLHHENILSETDMFGLDTSCANNENDLSLLDPLLNLPNDIITDEPMASVLQNEKDEQFEKNSLESILDEHNNSSFSIDTPKTPEIVANVQSVPITKPPKVLTLQDIGSDNKNKMPIIYKCQSNSSSYSIQQITPIQTLNSTVPLHKVAFSHKQSNSPIRVIGSPATICKINATNNQKVNQVSSRNLLRLSSHPVSVKTINGQKMTISQLSTQRLNSNPSIQKLNNLSTQKISVISTAPKISVDLKNANLIVDPRTGSSRPQIGANFQTSNSGTIIRRNCSPSLLALSKQYTSSGMKVYVDSNNMVRSALSETRKGLLGKVVLPNFENIPSASCLNVRISNVVARFRACCHLNLRHIATTSFDVIYDREKQKVEMKMRYPKCTAYMWSSGKVVCTGSTSAANSRKSALKFVKRLRKIGFQAKFSGYKVVNVLATAKMPFEVDIQMFSVANQGKQCSYEPEIHPGVAFRDLEAKAALKIFSTGSITVTAKSVERAVAAIHNVYPSLKSFYRAEKPNDLNAVYQKSTVDEIRKQSS